MGRQHFACFFLDLFFFREILADDFDDLPLERGIVGETPNLAARLQALAEPDEVVIAAGTRRRVGDLFEVRHLGAVEVKIVNTRPAPMEEVRKVIDAPAHVSE